MLSAMPWARWSLRLERGAGCAARVRWLMPVLLAVGGLLWLLVGTSPLSPAGQWQLFAVMALVALVIRRFGGRMPALILATVALLAMIRYVWWRSTQTLDFRTPAEALVGYALYAAEAYTWIVLLLGFV
jgi:cellulose synthase (UDP-forming)